MIRSQEEREENPESIRMDGMGLKVFPFIGGGEGPNLKLLSLQRNLISRLENSPSHLSHLMVLDLYDNRIERITGGLLGFTSLRVLLLGKNRFVVNLIHSSCVCQCCYFTPSFCCISFHFHSVLVRK